LEVAAVLPNEYNVPGAVEMASTNAFVPTESAPTEMVEVRARIMSVALDAAVSMPPM
jgi:hypothetical protein